MSRQDMVTERRYGDRAGNKWPTKITFLPKYFVHCKSKTIYLIAQLALCCVVFVVVVIFAVVVLRFNRLLWSSQVYIVKIKRRPIKT